MRNAFALIVALVAGLSAGSAFAACLSPAGNAGDLTYNGDYNVIQYCNGTDWVAAGEINPAAGSGTCSNPTFPEGHIMYNTDYSVMQFCNGQDWIAMGSTGSGSDTACGTSTTGFYVMTSALYNGDLATVAGGGLTGLPAADKICLDDLTANDWLCKSTASSRGLLTAAKVKASLCTSTTCNPLTASTRYYFAQAGDATQGGSFFQSDASGRGYGYISALSWSGIFGSTDNFWSNRGNGSGSSYWATTPEGVDCSGWTSSSSGVTGIEGLIANSTAARFASNTPIACNLTRRLLCMVNP